MWNPYVWASVPFHFWTAVFFVFGTMVGSFLNVCIHRLPRGESIVSPGSHCPHCGYAIPWYLNIPIFTWLFLRGKCAHCRAPISPRYFLVELLTGSLFALNWVIFGEQSVARVLAYCLIFSGFILATFIDIEHFIIPDEITLGGIAAGFLCSLAAPQIHLTTDRVQSLRESLWGIGAGAGIVYLILWLGKWLFGRQKITLPAESPVVFTETALQTPDRELPYDEIFYRKSDVIKLEAASAVLVLQDLSGPLPERRFEHVSIRLNPHTLQIGEESYNPVEVARLEAVASELLIPREAMGLGDVKFMAAIGAFLGWQAVVFSLVISAVLGAAVGVVLILMKKQEWSSRIPYGPYIALAAGLWIYLGPQMVHWWLAH